MSDKVAQATAAIAAANMLAAEDLAAEPKPVATPPDHAPSGDPALVSMPSDKLKTRLSESADAERRRLLKEFGFDSIEDGKRALKLFKEMQDAQLTEQQRIAKELDDLKPKALRADKLAQKLASMVDEQFATLPESAREAIDEIAAGDPEERLKLMAAMRKAGLGASASTNGIQRPVTTAAAPNAPKPGTPQTAYDKWQEMAKTGQMAGDIFYQTNTLAIERSRPAGH